MEYLDRRAKVGKSRQVLFSIKSVYIRKADDELTTIAVSMVPSLPLMVGTGMIRLVRLPRTGAPN